MAHEGKPKQEHALLDGKAPTHTATWNAVCKMKKGTSEPVYEKYVMGALGITKLKAK